MSSGKPKPLEHRVNWGCHRAALGTPQDVTSLVGDHDQKAIKRLVLATDKWNQSHPEARVAIGVDKNRWTIFADNEEQV